MRYKKSKSLGSTGEIAEYTYPASGKQVIYHANGGTHVYAPEYYKWDANDDGTGTQVVTGAGNDHPDYYYYQRSNISDAGTVTLAGNQFDYYYDGVNKYEFVGWATTEAKADAFEVKISPTQSTYTPTSWADDNTLHLYAVWSPVLSIGYENIDETYDDVNPNNVTSITYKDLVSNVYTLSDAKEDTNSPLYTFGGWYYKDDKVDSTPDWAVIETNKVWKKTSTIDRNLFEKLTTSGSNRVNGSITLYAKWTYRINYMFNLDGYDEAVHTGSSGTDYNDHYTKWAVDAINAHFDGYFNDLLKYDNGIGYVEDSAKDYIKFIEDKQTHKYVGVSFDYQRNEIHANDNYEIIVDSILMRDTDGNVEAAKKSTRGMYYEYFSLGVDEKKISYSGTESGVDAGKMNSEKIQKALTIPGYNRGNVDNFGPYYNDNVYVMDENNTPVYYHFWNWLDKDNKTIEEYVDTTAHANAEVSESVKNRGSNVVDLYANWEQFKRIIIHNDEKERNYYDSTTGLYKYEINKDGTTIQYILPSVMNNSEESRIGYEVFARKSNEENPYRVERNNGNGIIYYDEKFEHEVEVYRIIKFAGEEPVDFSVDILNPETSLSADATVITKRNEDGEVIERKNISSFNDEYFANGYYYNNNKSFEGLKEYINTPRITQADIDAEGSVYTQADLNKYKDYKVTQADIEAAGSTYNSDDKGKVKEDLPDNVVSQADISATNSKYKQADLGKIKAPSTGINGDWYLINDPNVTDYYIKWIYDIKYDLNGGAYKYEASDESLTGNYTSISSFEQKDLVYTLRTKLDPISALKENVEKTAKKQYTNWDVKMVAPTGYDFVGWNTKSDGSGVWYIQGPTGATVKDANVTDVPEGKTLFAIWAPNVTTVTLYVNGGNALPTNDDGKRYLPFNSNLNYNHTYTLGGGTRVKQSNDTTTEGRTNFDATVDEIKAYKKNNYNDFIDGTYPNIYLYNSDVVVKDYGKDTQSVSTKMDVPSREGYKFLGWFVKDTDVKLFDEQGNPYYAGKSSVETDAPYYWGNVGKSDYYELDTEETDIYSWAYCKTSNNTLDLEAHWTPVLNTVIFHANTPNGKNLGGVDYPANTTTNGNKVDDQLSYQTEIITNVHFDDATYIGLTQIKNKEEYDNYVKNGGTVYSNSNATARSVYTGPYDNNKYLFDAETGGNALTNPTGSSTADNYNKYRKAINDNKPIYEQPDYELTSYYDSEKSKTVTIRPFVPGIQHYYYDGTYKNVNTITKTSHEQYEEYLAKVADHKSIYVFPQTYTSTGVSWNVNAPTIAYVEGNIYWRETDKLNNNLFKVHGYTFSGWMKDSTGTTNDFENKANLSQVATSVDNDVIDLYALWNPNEYTVVYNANVSNAFYTEDGTNESISSVTSNAVGTMDNTVVKYDEEFNLSENKYTLTGYSFMGWSTTPTGWKSDSTKHQKIGYSGGASDHPSWSFYNDKETVKNLSYAEEDSTKTVNLYAMWCANPYTIHFDSNKPASATSTMKDTGDNGMSDQNFIYDVGVCLNENKFSLFGYKFIGWNTSADGSGNMIADKGNITSFTAPVGKDGKTITLYAQWEARPYTITFDTNGGSSVSNINTTFDSTVKLPKTSRVGYDFDGWYLSEPVANPIRTSDWTGITEIENGVLDNRAYISTATETHTIPTTIKVYAKWVPHKYTVKLDVNTGKYPHSFTIADYSSSRDANKYYHDETNSYVIFDTYYDDAEFTLPKPYREGYKFLGWSTEKFDDADYIYAAGTNYNDFTDVDNETVVLHARWSKLSFAITYEANKPENATTSIEDNTSYSSHWVDEVKRLSKNNFTLDGYDFAGWRIKDKDSSSLGHIFEQDLVAYFDLISRSNFDARVKNIVEDRVIAKEQDATVTNVIKTTESIKASEIIAKAKEILKKYDGETFHYETDIVCKQTVVSDRKYDEIANDALSYVVSFAKQVIDQDKYDTWSEEALIGYQNTLAAIAYNSPIEDAEVSFIRDLLKATVLIGGNVDTPVYTFNSNNYISDWNSVKSEVIALAKRYYGKTYTDKTLNDSTVEEFAKYCYEYLGSTLNQKQLKGLYVFDDEEYVSELFRIQVTPSYNPEIIYGYTLEAIWLPHTYSITFDSNKPEKATYEVEGSMADVEDVIFDSEVANKTYSLLLPENKFTIEGWTFDGWNTNADGSGTYYKNKAEIKNLNKKDLRTIVKKELDTIAVDTKFEFELDGKKYTYLVGRHSKEIIDITTDLINEFIAECKADKSDYSEEAVEGFNATLWMVDDTSSNEAIKFISKILIEELNFNFFEVNSVTPQCARVVIDDPNEIILYAQWKQNKYTVNYDANVPATASTTVSGIEQMGSQEFTYDEVETLREEKDWEASAKGFKLPGYTFQGWRIKVENANYNDVVIDFVRDLINNSILDVTYDRSTNKFKATLKTKKDITTPEGVSEVSKLIDDLLVSDKYANKDFKFVTLVKNDSTNRPNIKQQFYTEVEKLIKDVKSDKNGWSQGALAGHQETLAMLYTFSKTDDNAKTGTITYKVDSVKNLVRNGSITLQAQWAPNTYTVTFHHGTGATGSDVKQTLTFDEVAETLRPYANDFKRSATDNKIFDVWNTKEDGTGTSYEDGAIVKNLTTTPYDNIDLYAQWTDENKIDYLMLADDIIVKGSKYDWVLETQDKSIINPNVHSIKQGTLANTRYELSNALTRDGYVFDGFYREVELQEDGSYKYIGQVTTVNDCEINTDGHIKIYEKWIAKTYNVKFAGNEPKNTSQVVAFTQQGVNGLVFGKLPKEDVAIPTLRGYSFLGYYDKKENGTQYINAEGKWVAPFNEDLRTVARELLSTVAADTKFEFTVDGVKYSYVVGKHNEEILDATIELINKLIVECKANKTSWSVEAKQGFKKTIDSIKKDSTDPAIKFISTLLIDNLMFKVDGDKVSINDPSTVTLHAHWKAKEYTIAIDPNGGDTAKTIKETFDASVNNLVVSNLPARKGYVLKSLNTKADGTGASYFVTETGTITNIAGKDWNSTSTDVTYTKATELKHESVWDIAGDVDSVDHDEDGNAVLYCVWEPVHYSITYKVNKPVGSTSTQNKDSYTYIYEYDERAKFADNEFTLPGYKFVKWDVGQTADQVYANGVEAGAEFINLTSTFANNITVNAVWEPIKYNVEYDPNLEGKGEQAKIIGTIPSTNVAYDYDFTLAENFYKVNNYKFAGWSTVKNGDTTNTHAAGSTLRSLTTVDNSTVTLYAQWTNRDYVINYISNKPAAATSAVTGSMAATTFNYPQIIGANVANDKLRPNAFALKGWTFLGWSLDAAGSKLIAADSTITGDVLEALSNSTDGTVKLYAQWKSIGYTITFNTNDGTYCEDIVTNYDGTYVLPTTTKTGYLFEGWFVATDFTGTKVTNNQNLTENGSTIKLNAKWTPVKYSIVLDYNHDSVPTTTISNVAYDGQVVLTTPERTGYVFLGWNTKADGTGVKTYAAKTYAGADAINLTTEDKASVTLYAQWIACDYTIKLNVNGGTMSESNTIGAKFDQKIGTLPTPTKAGYNFEGWFLADDEVDSEDKNLTSTPNDVITLVAKWTAKDYTINLDANGGTVTPTSKTATYGENVQLPTPTRESYVFTGWNNKADGTGDRTYGANVDVKNLTVNSSITLYAQWSFNEFTVQLDANKTYYVDGVAKTSDASGKLVVDEDSKIVEAYEYSVNGFKVGDVVVIDGTSHTVAAASDEFKVNKDSVITVNGVATDCTHNMFVSNYTVSKININGDNATTTKLEKLDNIVTYAGTSIRLTGEKGIRTRTSIDTAKRTELLSATGYDVNGTKYEAIEYGTLIGWADNFEDGEEPVLERVGFGCSKGRAYSKADRINAVFSTDATKTYYTNTYIGISTDKVKDDFAVRPYIILRPVGAKDASGDLTIYGGTFYRNVYSEAKKYENVNLGASGNAYIKSLIQAGDAIVD